MHFLDFLSGLEPMKWRSHWSCSTKFCWSSRSRKTRQLASLRVHRRDTNQRMMATCLWTDEGRIFIGRSVLIILQACHASFNVDFNEIFIRLMTERERGLSLFSDYSNNNNLINHLNFSAYLNFCRSSTMMTKQACEYVGKKIKYRCWRNTAQQTEI